MILIIQRLNLHILYADHVVYTLTEYNFLSGMAHATVAVCLEIKINNKIL